MERNNTTNHEAERYDKGGRTMGRFVARLMAKLHSRLSSESGPIGHWRGSGAPLLGDNPGIKSKEQADAFIGELLGRNPDR